MEDLAKSNRTQHLVDDRGQRTFPLMTVSLAGSSTGRQVPCQYSRMSRFFKSTTWCLKPDRGWNASSEPGT